MGRHSTLQSDNKIGATEKKGAQVALLVRVIKKFGYQGNLRERLSYSRDELLGSAVVERETQNQRRRARGQRGRKVSRTELVRYITVVKLEPG